MMLAMLVLLVGCTSASDTGYTRTRTPLGVTDSQGPEGPTEDTGPDTGAL